MILQRRREIRLSLLKKCTDTLFLVPVSPVLAFIIYSLEHTLQHKDELTYGLLNI